MKTFEKQAAQGDILLTKIDRLPKRLSPQKPEQGKHILAHSETGHHHVINAEKAFFYKNESDPMICYLVANAPVELEHLRPFDTHESLTIGAGIYEIRSQREYAPEGRRKIVD